MGHHLTPIEVVYWTALPTVPIQYPPELFEHTLSHLQGYSRRGFGDDTETFLLILTDCHSHYSKREPRHGL